MTLSEQEILMNKMIWQNPEATVGEFWKMIEDPTKAVERLQQSVSLPMLPHVRFMQVFKMVKLREPMKDPSPYKRPPARYDNRGHNKIIEEYS